MNEGSDLGTPQDSGPIQLQPNQVITPTAPAAPALPIPPAPEAVATPALSVPVPPQPPEAPGAQPVQLPQPEPQALPQQPTIDAAPFDPTPDQYQGQEPELDQSPITWSASEFIANQKSSNWYVLLALASIVVGAAVWLLTRDLFPTIAVLVGVILLGVYAGRQPRQQTYTLDAQGLTIGGQHYGYETFRSFAVVPDGAFLSIELAPLKRFSLGATIYVAPDDEDRILDRLSQHLPMDEAHPNLTDNLMRRIKF